MLEFVLKEHRKDLGGFEVGRVLPAAQRRMVGPFVFFDHLGPLEFAPNIPQSMDVRPHPHIGLATVTYLFNGEITHRDSVGSKIEIAPGEVNWMVAGRGITHSERFDGMRQRGGLIDAIQTWVALPNEAEETAPDFAHADTALLPGFAERGISGRLIAGSAFGMNAKVKTYSPMFYLHLEMATGARGELPQEHSERAAYIVSGEIEYQGQKFGPGQMLVFKPGPAEAFTALAPSSVMLLGGEPVGPRFIEWNFVASSRERIEQAKADWRAGRMKLPDLDDQEFIPLPG